MSLHLVSLGLFIFFFFLVFCVCLCDYLFEQPNCKKKKKQISYENIKYKGMRFYTYNWFLAGDSDVNDSSTYENAVIIAQHGSWNRNTKIGYRVMVVKLSKTSGFTQPQTFEVFVEGWLNGNSVSGRPVDIELLYDGSIIISDDYASKIWRVYFNGMFFASFDIFCFL